MSMKIWARALRKVEFLSRGSIIACKSFVVKQVLLTAGAEQPDNAQNTQHRS